MSFQTFDQLGFLCSPGIFSLFMFVTFEIVYTCIYLCKVNENEGLTESPVYFTLHSHICSLTPMVSYVSLSLTYAVTFETAYPRVSTCNANANEVLSDHQNFFIFGNHICSVWSKYGFLFALRINNCVRFIFSFCYTNDELAVSFTEKLTRC